MSTKMAIFGDDAIVPRKRIATYGKSVHRRIPEYNFGSQSQATGRKQSESLPSRSPSIAPTEPKKLKSVPQISPSKPHPSTLPASANVFDVPSSDEEAPLSTKPAKAPPKPVKSQYQRALTTGEMAKNTTGDTERRKRIKLSPARPLPQKPNAVKSPAKQSIPDRTTQPPKPLQRPMGAGKTSTIAGMPKSVTVNRRLDAARIPRKLSPVPQRTTLNTPSPRRTAGSDMMDLDTPAQFISPRGTQMWKELLDPLEADEEDDLAGGGKSSPRFSSKTLYKPAGVPKHSQNTPRKLPRRRLIDSLVEQAIHVDEIDDEEPDLEEPDLSLNQSLDGVISGAQDRSRSQSLAPEFPVPPTLPASQGSQIAGPKRTYSRQRSMLEEDMMQQLHVEIPTQPAQPPNGRRPRRGSLPILKPLQCLTEEEEAEDGAATAIRSVHELRQAGANNRFLDEIEDLLDTIGMPSMPPSSMRRSGLLELASKFQDKNFARQFRSNGVEQRLFLHLGQETDVIAGFIMVSILMAVLADASMPHIVAQLRRQGITRLLIRLIESHVPIVALSKDRKSNMSKLAQSLILEHQAFILTMPTWEELQPQVVTARTVALKCLELMVRQTREAGSSGDIISKELTTNLFSILKSGGEEDSWELPQGKEAIDFYLALSTLESHSIVARTVHDESIWINDYLPIIADTLEIALTRPTDDFGPLQGLLLRLTLNVTNNNPNASDVFARPALMAVMGQVIVAKFKKILRFLFEEEFSVAVDHLVLVLGVMINFAEWSAPARESLQTLQGKDVDPLENMVRLFVENKTRTSEAESVEESQKNVAFGYLSVLLGYLSLLPAISTRIAAQQPRKTLRPLLESIEEFIGHHKAADRLIEQADDGYNAQTGLTQRLESLVAKLAGP